MQLFVNFLIIRTYGEESIQLFTATNNRVDHNVARHSLCLLRRQKETQCVCAKRSVNINYFVETFRVKWGLIRKL